MMRKNFGAGLVSALTIAVAAVAAVAAVGSETDVQSGGGYELISEILPKRPPVVFPLNSYELRATVVGVHADWMSAGDEVDLSIRRGPHRRKTDPCACLCDGAIIFADGFESGDTSLWTTAAP